MHVLVAAAILAMSCNSVLGQPRNEPNPVNFTGHYELANATSDRTISLDITQAGPKATISFSAAMNDGSGAAPDGEGTGKVEKAGVLKFTFTDSFRNECSGTLVHEKNGYRLDINPTTVVDPKPLRFYGNALLKKTAAEPSS
jgi:hypothetical protein